MNNCCIIQVTNISPSCTSNQVETLFAILGRIEEMHLYPKEESSVVSCRSCCIRYSTPAEARLATHLTNTVFIDKTLSIGHPRFETLASERQVNYSELMSPDSHRHGSRGDSPPYSSRSDPAMQDEIRRTIYVGNLTHETTAEQVMKFFVGCGEIKFVRMAGDQSQMTRFAFIEFTDPNSIARAIQMNGAIFGDRVLKVNYSKKAIVKPNSSASRLDPFAKENEALRRVKEASRFISEVVGSTEDHRSSRSHSHDRKKHWRSKSPKEHSSSRYSRKPSLDYRSDPFSRSRSPRERKTRSRSPRRSFASNSRERSRERGARKSHRSSQSPRSDRRNGGHHSREEKKHSSKHSHSHKKEGKSEHSESRSRKGKDSKKHSRQSPNESPHKHKSKSKHSKKHKHRQDEHSPPSKKRPRRRESASDLEY